MIFTRRRCFCDWFKLECIAKNLFVELWYIRSQYIGFIHNSKFHPFKFILSSSFPNSFRNFFRYFAREFFRYCCRNITQYFVIDLNHPRIASAIYFILSPSIRISSRESSEDSSRDLFIDLPRDFSRMSFGIFLGFLQQLTTELLSGFFGILLEVFPRFLQGEF